MYIVIVFNMLISIILADYFKLFVYVIGISPEPIRLYMNIYIAIELK